jgi:hypothetical protein
MCSMSLFGFAHSYGLSWIIVEQVHASDAWAKHHVVVRSIIWYGVVFPDQVLPTCTRMEDDELVV